MRFIPVMNPIFGGWGGGSVGGGQLSAASLFLCRRVGCYFESKYTWGSWLLIDDEMSLG